VSHDSKREFRVDHDPKHHSDARKKAEAMFGRAQGARPAIETEDGARRRLAREKITRLKSLRTRKGGSQSEE
jgi:hypothetical protein